LTSEDARYVVIVRLSKPPFIEDLVKAVLEESDFDVSKLQSLPYARLELARVLAARGLKELDDSLRSAFEAEVGEVKSHLPRSYVGVADVLMELNSLEGYPALIKAGAPTPYSECKQAEFSCVIRVFLRRLAEAMGSTGESPEPPLLIVGLVTYSMYARHVEGLKKLGLAPSVSKEELYSEVLGLAGGCGAVYFTSGKSRLDSLLHVWAKNPAKYVAEEARVVYEASQTSLYFAGGLLNILTHFFVTRFYEGRLLRIIASRRLLHGS
jgi:hypothetical protein